MTHLLAGNGMFKHLGEQWFDDYWMNYGKITVAVGSGSGKKTRQTKKIIRLKDFLIYRGHDPDLVNPRARQPARAEKIIESGTSSVTD